MDLSQVPEPTEAVGPIRIELEQFLETPERVRLLVSVAIGPDPGSFWLGIDPGTSGACIAGGADLAELDSVPLVEGRKGEDRYVAPSLVYVCASQCESSEPETLCLRWDSLELAFQAGVRAELRERIDESRMFRSAKRMIGYKNTYELEYECLEEGDNEPRSQKIRLQGSDAVRMLATYLLARGQKYFASQPQIALRPKLNKVVVAVPNSFTPAKISQMKECCLTGCIEQVEHIYEAEAVLMFYLWRQDEVTARLPSELDDLRRGDGESVLVFDFGGHLPRKEQSRHHWHPKKLAFVASTVSGSHSLAFCAGGFGFRS